MAGEGIQLFIYSKNDPETLLDVLPGRIKPTYVDEVGGAGGGTFSVNTQDPRVLENPSLLDYRNVVKVKVDGNVVGAFQIQKKNSEIIATEEGSQEVYNIAGPGLLSWLEDAQVRPFGGLKAWSPDKRFFNFASEPGDWYIPGEWGGPYVKGQVFQIPVYGKRPLKWPEKSTAKWLWANSSETVGTSYFRHTFNISTPGSHVIYVAGDDFMDVWLDGAQIVATDLKVRAYGEATRIEVHLHSGTHYIGIRCNNTGGPAGVLEAVYAKNTDDSETLISSTSNTGNWKVQAYPTTPPGWTLGEVFLTLLDEAEDRGVLFPTWITCNFTAELDSRGNPWPAQYDWDFGVTDSLFTVLSKITESGFEAWIDPDTYELFIAQFRGNDRTIDPGGIVFEQGKNLTKAASEGVGKIKNTLAVKTADGWMLSDNTDATSISEYGTIEGSLTADVSAKVAKSIVQGIFKQRANPEEGATYNIHPTPEEIPWEKVFPGDWVLAPNDRMLKVPRRIMSLSISEDPENGGAVYAAEFDTIFQSNESRINRVINKSPGGGLGSNYSSAVGNPGFNAPITVTPGGPPLKYPKPPTGLSGTSSGYWSADGVTAYSDVTLTWDDVIQNTDDTELVPSGYIVHAAQVGETGYNAVASVTDNTVTLKGLPPDTEWSFKLQTIGDDSITSVFSSPEFFITMEGPTEPMDAPDDPTLSSSMGLLTVSWNGLLLGNNPPPQFRYVFAEVAPDVAGTPGTWTRMGPSLSRDGRNIVIPNLTVGNDYWARLIAVDGAGIASDASDAVMQEIIGVDLGDLDSDVTDAIDAAHQAAIDAKSSVNLLEDPSFEQITEEFWDWDNSNVTNTDLIPRTGERHLRLEATGSSYEALRYKLVLEADPADSFLFRLFYRNESGDPLDSQDEGVELVIESGPTADDLSTSTTVAFTSELQLADEYEVVQGSWVVPTGHFFFQPVLYVNDTTSTNVYYIDDIRVLRMTGVSLLVDGAVVADKISAGAVTAIHMSAGSIASEAIQAEAITADKLAADSVTANAIKAGEIEANHIAAGAIEVTHLAPSVGDTINIAGNVSIQAAQEAIDGVADDLSDTNDAVATMKTYYDFGPSGAVISTPGSPFATAVRSDRIEMLENGQVISYWNSGQLVVSQLVAEKLLMGNHQVEQISGGTIIRHVG